MQRDAGVWVNEAGQMKMRRVMHVWMLLARCIRTAASRSAHEATARLHIVKVRTTQRATYRLLACACAVQT